jgi:hypothetical protein
MLAFAPFSNLTWLLVQESFIEFGHCESFKLEMWEVLMSSLCAEVEERGSLCVLLVGKLGRQSNKETERG